MLLVLIVRKKGITKTPAQSPRRRKKPRAAGNFLDPGGPDRKRNQTQTYIGIDLKTNSIFDSKKKKKNKKKRE